MMFEHREDRMPIGHYIVAGLAAACALTATAAGAQVCDYRPSQLLRSDTAGSVLSSARGAASGLVARVDGAFVLTNVFTGGSVLGSNAGAGALGQIGSAAVGVATSPGAAMAGTVAALGAGTYEGVCFFRDERITDYDEVLEVMQSVAAFADPAHFRVEEHPSVRNGAVAVFGDGTGAAAEFAVRRLRIVNGTLLHSEWGLDTELGYVGYLTSIREVE